jgi:hypothetical protein
MTIIPLVFPEPPTTSLRDDAPTPHHRTLPNLGQPPRSTCPTLLPPTSTPPTTPQNHHPHPRITLDPSPPTFQCYLSNSGPAR